MNNYQLGLINDLMDTTCSYYTEQTEGEREGAIAYKVPDDQPEKAFIETVFLALHSILKEEEKKIMEGDSL
jgi:hypothetical protein